MKRVFIVHGWDGNPEEGCFPWLKKELEARGFEVAAPTMPKPLEPEIMTWVSFLKNQIGRPDEKTYLFGHSIGAQTILRYLESLEEDAKIGGAVFLAGWIHLGSAAYEAEEDATIAKPWLETPLDWKKIKSHCNQFTAIFSDNDPFVPLSDSDIFKEKMGAKIVVEHNQRHFSGSDGLTELPSALNALLTIAA